jgi:DNA adenine methylase
MKAKQPIKYHGGKYYLAPKIIAAMPEHTHYLEAFAGGLSVLLNKPCEGVSETVNDINGDLINFWRVLADPDLFEQFHRRVGLLPLSEELFHGAKNSKANSPAERAADYFVRMRQSRQGLGTSYCTPTKRTRGGMNENVSAWLGAVEGLPGIHERLKRVEVLNRDATDLIKRLDHENLLVYCDPPYMRQVRSSPDLYGEFEMTYSDHEELLSVLSQMKGKFMLSGYDSKLYQEYAESYAWDRMEFDLPNNSSGHKVKQRKTEVVWTNYAI